MIGIGREQKLLRVLCRQTELDTLSSLIGSLREDHTETPLERTAIGLDASVFLRLAGHAKSADVLDYLDARHTAPLVIPGQAIQEFWNNQLSVVDTISSSLKKKFDAISDELARAETLVSPHIGTIGVALVELREEYGHIYDDNTKQRTLGMLEILQRRASIPYANRSSFSELVRHRKRTKTPPGFKDEGDGDFFIWVDFLTGLQAAKPRQGFDRVAFVTQDTKADWSRAGMPHPILAAEIKALFGCHFEIWNLQTLVDEIAQAT